MYNKISTQISLNYENPKVLGIVGIRSGSKGIPNKNIRTLKNKPLVGWILEAAQKSKFINKLVVSTDSEDYAKIVRIFGAETPYIRPEKFSTDHSPEFDFIKHMLEWLDKNENYKPDIIVRLVATVPLQKSSDIDSVVNILLNDQKADSAVVISEARQHPMKSLKIVKDSEGKEKLVTYFSNSSREVTPIARQSYEKAYFRSNVIAFKRNTLFNTNSLTGDIVRFHKIQQERALDIDSEMDFILAEFLFNNLNSSSKCNIV
jgi:CMP-N,N'-diacetyllegionaminic acid synthase